MASGTVARLNIQLLANPSQLLSGFARAQTAITSFSSGAAAALARIGAGFSAAAVVGFGVKLAADLEKASVGFEVMIGNAALAHKTLEDIRKFADSTPFQFTGLQETASQLLAANIAAQDILPTLSVLGDISRGDQARLDLIAKAYTDVANKGKLAGQEIRQFAENGVGIVGQLAEQFGVTRAEVTKLSEDGKISFADVQRALIAMTSEGGRFHGMMERTSQTLSGRWSTLVDTVKRLATSIGEVLIPAAKNLTEAFIGIVTAANSMAGTFSTNVIKVAAFAAAWVAMMAVGARVVSLIRSVIAAYQALTIAQTIQQSLSGPKGWAILAAGIAAAGIAAAGVNAAFSQANAKVAEASQVSKDAAAGIARLKSVDSKAVDPLGLQAAAKKAEELEKVLKRLAQQGEQVRKSVRLPGEIFAETVLELQRLSQVGAIQGSTFERAILKAKDEYLEAIKATSEAKVEATPGVGALSLGTREAFSAIQQAQREAIAARETEKLQRRQLEAANRANEWLREITINTRTQPIEISEESL